MTVRPIATILSTADVTRDPTERLATLFDTHADRLYRLARRLTSSGDDARDLVQEAFLRAAASLTMTTLLAGLANEEAWLGRVLVNIQRDQLRKAEVRRPDDIALWTHAPVVADSRYSVEPRSVVVLALRSSV